MGGKTSPLPWGSGNQRDRDKSSDTQSQVKVIGFVELVHRHQVGILWLKQKHLQIVSKRVWVWA